MNTVGPYHNRQETYTYFSLPFCKGTKKDISHYHETLGEAIQGVELDFSGIDISFKGTVMFSSFHFFMKPETLIIKLKRLVSKNVVLHQQGISKLWIINVKLTFQVVSCMSMLLLWQIC